MIIFIAITIAILFMMFLQGCNKPDKPTEPEPPSPDLPPEAPKYRALFTGVSKYDNYDGSIDLITPELDVIKMQTLFSRFRYTDADIPVYPIRALVNHEASKQGIFDAIHDTFVDAKDTDVSFFLYGGHGGVRNGNPIITPADYKYTDFSTMITVHELKAEFDKIKGHKVIILETCHGGNFIERGARTPDFDTAVIDIFSVAPKDTMNRPNYYVITSSAGSQYSWENTFFKYSYFIKPFIAGCEGLKADTDNDSKVSLNEIYIYVRDWLAKQTLPEPQTPQVYPEDSDFIIGEY